MLHSRARREYYLDPGGPLGLPMGISLTNVDSKWACSVAKFSGQDLRRAQFSGIQMSGLKVSTIPSSKPPRPAAGLAGGVINGN